MAKKEKNLPSGIINPFSPQFLDIWDQWKQYKWEEFKFKYKGVLSEQAGLMELNNISHQDEEIAVQIIMRSMAKKWKGLFEIKNNGNGKSKEQFTRDGVNADFTERDYTRWQSELGAGG